MFLAESKKYLPHKCESCEINKSKINIVTILLQVQGRRKVSDFGGANSIKSIYNFHEKKIV